MAARASTALASWTGVIARNEGRKAAAKSATELTLYQCSVLAAARMASADDLRRASECTRANLEKEPRNATAWASLAGILTIQRFTGFGLEAPASKDVSLRAEIGERSIEAGRRAVELAPTDAYAQFSLARAYYAVCNRDLLRSQAERALALNPNDATTMGLLANYLGNAGFWTTGVELAEKAIALAGPTAPYSWGWVIAKDAWLRGEHSQALDEIQKARAVEAPWLFHLQFAYMLPSLGRIDDAKTQVAMVLRARPDFTISLADAYYRMWCFEDSYREKMRAALRAAGMPE